MTEAALVAEHPAQLGDLPVHLRDRVTGVASPYSSSARRSIETTRLAWSRSSASTARWLRPPSPSSSPSRCAWSGPRMRNSVTESPR